MGIVENSRHLKKTSMNSLHRNRKGQASVPAIPDSRASGAATWQPARDDLRENGGYDVFLPRLDRLETDKIDMMLDWIIGETSRFSHPVSATVRASQDFLSNPFFSFDQVLDFVNPLMSKASEALGKTNLSLALSLAEMEARSVRIDRTQSESRAILKSLMS